MEYALYWNSQTADSSVSQIIHQLGQVKLACRVDSYQENAVAVEVKENNMLHVDPVASRVDIGSDLILEISHLPFVDANNFFNRPITTVTNTAGGTLGNPDLTYTGNLKLCILSNTFLILFSPCRRGTCRNW